MLLVFIWFQHLTLYQPSLDTWIVPQPRKNVWVTLAHALQQDHLCLSTSAAENPLSTCLVGIPAKLEEYPTSLRTIQSKINSENSPNKWLESFRYWGIVSTPKTPIEDP